MSNTVFQTYESDPKWTVFRDLPDTEGVRQLAHLAGTFASDAYVVQPRLASNKLDVAFLNLSSQKGGN